MFGENRSAQALPPFPPPLPHALPRIRCFTQETHTALCKVLCLRKWLCASCSAQELLFASCSAPQPKTYCGWTKSISHHLRNPGMRIPLQIPTNHGFNHGFQVVRKADFVTIHSRATRPSANPQPLQRLQPPRLHLSPRLLLRLCHCAHRLARRTCEESDCCGAAAPRKRKVGASSILWMVAKPRNRTVQTPWNDSPANINKQWFQPWFQSGAGFRPSTIWGDGCGQSKSALRWWFANQCS